jgi:hypothetical protein
MANEFSNVPGTNSEGEEVAKKVNKESVDIVNARIKSAFGTLKELGFSPTTEDGGVEAVFELARMYERQTIYKR